MDLDTEPRTSSGAYLKLKDGESIVGILQGKAHTYYAKWQDEGGFAPVDEDTPGASFRFSLNFCEINKDKKMENPVVWEQGKKVWKFLQELNKDFPLEKTFIKIKRMGSDKSDTTYTILPVTKIKVADMQKQLDHMDLHEFGVEKLKFKEDDDLPF